MVNRIMQIKSCKECKFKIQTTIGWWICQHPQYLKSLGEKGIYGGEALQLGKIPGWCPLEEYREK